MATRLFGLNPGQSLENVSETVGPATTTSNVELNVDLATSIVTDSGVTRTIQREEVLIIINILSQYVERVKWPPA